MSFSSAEWTIPELCVWIVTLDRSAVNGLSSRIKRSLKYANMIHDGAYAARDEVIEAAQQGKIVVTAAGTADRYRSNPDRIRLSREFWNNAEIEDASHWQAAGSFWCVARQVGQPNTSSEFRDLLVSRDDVLREWAERPVRQESPPPFPDDRAMSPALPVEEQDKEYLCWMMEDVVRRFRLDEQRDRDTMAVAVRDQFPDSKPTFEKARALYDKLPEEIRSATRGRPKGSKNSGQK